MAEQLLPPHPRQPHPFGRSADLPVVLAVGVPSQLDYRSNGRGRHVDQLADLGDRQETVRHILRDVPVLQVRRARSSASGLLRGNTMSPRLQRGRRQTRLN